jgi:hypothetical protein
MRDRNYFFQDSGIVIDEQLNDFIDNNKSRFLKIANITSYHCYLNRCLQEFLALFFPL